MNQKERTILETYKTQKSDFVKLEQIALKQVQKIVDECDVRIYTINHRIKEEKSLAGKLERKGEKYTTLLDITDILGLRIVCFFADDVDLVAKKVESVFDIDWEESIDKRKYLDIKSFGYLSVHYICSLKDDGTVPPELLKIRFEVQMCSLLQHVWAVMEHDLGYKTKFGVPAAVSREFSRLAGLLEIADEHFSRIRDKVSIYTTQVHQKIVEDNAADIPIDLVSLEEYMRYSKSMSSFLENISKTCHAEILNESPENYLNQLAWLKKETLGDLQNMLVEDSELAMQMIEKTLAVTDLDIFSSTVALRFLCRAELIIGGYTEKQAADFFYLSTKDKQRSLRYAKELFSDN
ncbi:MAG: hypothetical protein K6G52_05590 [Treponemataceae bacterium]|nr:hypothetical protein [Treponemataceae bacterium]